MSNRKLTRWLDSYDHYRRILRVGRIEAVRRATYYERHGHDKDYAENKAKMETYWQSKQ